MKNRFFILFVYTLREYVHKEKHMIQEQIDITRVFTRMWHKTVGKAKVFVAIGFCLFLTVGTLQAATLVVTDSRNAGPNTLRGRVAVANNGDVIVFDKTINLINLSSQILLNKNLTIRGPALISGRNTTRIFGVPDAITVSLDRLTLINGKAADGGAIFVAGSLNVTNSTFQGNIADGFGGAIEIQSSNGTVNVSSSTFLDNFSPSFGGAIDNFFGILNVANSTFVNNRAGLGGALQNCGTSLIVTNCSILNNFAEEGGGINFRTFTILNNTIVAANSAPLGPDILSSTDLISNGHNFIGTTLGITNAGSLTDKTFENTNTTLEDLVETNNGNPVLADNGGPTKTVALVCASPAIDCGSNKEAKGLSFDQRGPCFPRIINGTVDIGAFEFGRRCC